MKKIIPMLVILLLLFGIIDYKYTRSKYKNLTFVVEHSVTTGINNSYKLKNLETLQVTFTDGKLAIVAVTGTQKNAPYKLVKYHVLVEKGSGDIWKVKKVYNIP